MAVFEDGWEPTDFKLLPFLFSSRGGRHGRWNHLGLLDGGLGDRKADVV